MEAYGQCKLEPGKHYRVHKHLQGSSIH